MDLFCEGRQQVTIIFQSALSFIHITGDSYTSSNHPSAWRIVGHFAFEKRKVECLLLLLTKIKAPHKGENQTNMIIATLLSYDIRNRLGYFVRNNASSNDILMDYISSNLESDRISYLV